MFLRLCAQAPIGQLQSLTPHSLYAKIRNWPAKANKGYAGMTGKELINKLLELPCTSESSQGTLMGRVRDLIGNIFWEDLSEELDPKAVATIYLFKKIADDVFFDFAQDASVSLDTKLADGREVLFHLDEVLIPLVNFVQKALKDSSDDSQTYLYLAIEKYLALMNYFTREGRGLALKGGK